ncbi:MAG: LpxL/LpxP family Kdo(2)-lipid IV(A) lauroyl/palmitoleoyl acyltransferase [Gammaproteobacteria bacterium]|nr:MAG: LpxL/LpxP family Kdo(2)-lipid IV(A) lauroyl/palmitoleoyl acyltransferase [Gammaproteobacteria bacterium]
MARHVSVDFRARDYWHPRFWPMWINLGILRTIALFPYRCQIFLGGVFGKLIQILSPKRQRVVDINLQLCFPEKSVAERNKIKNASFQNLGIALLEMSMCWWWSEDRLRSLVEIRGREHIEAVLDSGRGVILLTGHFTSLEIGGRLFTLSMPLQAMYRTQKNRMFDSYLYTRRKSYLENAISRKNTRQMIRGIKKLIPTWYAPDQNFPNEKNVFAPFMGVQTATISASSRLAQSTGGAMLPFYPERKKDGSGYIIWIEPPLVDFPSGDDVRDATAINASIEKFVRLNPEQYLWAHKRFKTRPPGEPAIYP